MRFGTLFVLLVWHMQPSAKASAKKLPFHSAICFELQIGADLICC
jgi:hypothetical protein